MHLVSICHCSTAMFDLWSSLGVFYKDLCKINMPMAYGVVTYKKHYLNEIIILVWIIIAMLASHVLFISFVQDMGASTTWAQEWGGRLLWGASFFCKLFGGAGLSIRCLGGAGFSVSYLGGAIGVVGLLISVWFCICGAKGLVVMEELWSSSK